MMRILIGTEEELKKERYDLRARGRKHGRAVEGVTMRDVNGVQVMLVKPVEASNSDLTNGSDSNESMFTVMPGLTVFSPSTCKHEGDS